MHTHGMLDSATIDSAELCVIDVSAVSAIMEIDASCLGNLFMSSRYYVEEQA